MITDNYSSTRPSKLPRNIVTTFLIAFALSCCPVASSAIEAEWVLPQRFRIRVTAEPYSSQRDHCPAGITVDFQRLLHGAGIHERLDRHSIRVVAEGKVVPHTTTADLPNDQKGTVWWRMKTGPSKEFSIYFDTGVSASPRHDRV